MYDIIIIGAGPAGLTAAIYARRASRKTLVLEANAYGGQIINTLEIENYPAEKNISGFDLATKMYDQAKDLGAEIKFERAIQIRNDGDKKEVKTEEDVYYGKAVIIATGSSNRKLGLLGEDELVGKGISYCATCDGAFYKDKIVAVNGGGNTALEDAIYLCDVAKKVYLIHRRSEFRGDDLLVERLKKKNNVDFILDSTIVKLNADGKLQSVVIENRDGKKREIKVDGLFVAIGRIPENKEFENLVELDEAGYVIADENCATNESGIFVAGDNRTKSVRQLVTATADGAIAATEAIKNMCI